MSSFTCACGVVTRGEEQAAASAVAYPLSTLHAMESAIANDVLGFFAAGGGEHRSAWLSSYFGPGYPADATEREVIEDIISRVFDNSFTSIFQCPACKRIALYENDADGWVFYTRA